MSASARLVDLSHPIEAGMITYPGLPAPVVSEFLSRPASAERYSEGTTFSIGRVEMVANTGTYVDAPFHRFEQGVDVGALPLEKLADLEGIVIDAGNEPDCSLEFPPDDPPLQAASDTDSDTTAAAAATVRRTVHCINISSVIGSSRSRRRSAAARTPSP